MPGECWWESRVGPRLGTWRELPWRALLCRWLTSSVSFRTRPVWRCPSCGWMAVQRAATYCCSFRLTPWEYLSCARVAWKVLLLGRPSWPDSVQGSGQNSMRSQTSGLPIVCSSRKWPLMTALSGSDAGLRRLEDQKAGQDEQKLKLSPPDLLHHVTTERRRQSPS